VTVLGQVQSVITVAPQRVDMKELRVGETVVHKVMLKAATPFQVQPLTDEAEGISIKPGLNSAAPLQIVEVTFTPRKPGTISKVLQLRTNLANGLSVPLPFEATVVTK
jgi:hypothetical protein